VAALLMFIGVKAGVFTPKFLVRGITSTEIVTGKGPWELCSMIVNILFSLNLLLGVFNLLPMPPLDGSNIPLLWLQGRTAEKYQMFIYQPQIQILTFILAWQFAGHIIWPVFDKSLDLLQRILV
jgi:Zn-dependent protease